MRCSAARRLRRYKAMQRKNTEIKAIFIAVTVVFSAFLLIPAVRLLLKSFYEGGFTTAFYGEVLIQEGFGQALLNSFAVSGAAACIATVIAFALAYAVILLYMRRHAPQKTSDDALPPETSLSQ